MGGQANEDTSRIINSFVIKANKQGLQYYLYKEAALAQGRTLPHCFLEWKWKLTTITTTSNIA